MIIDKKKSNRRRNCTFVPESICYKSREDSSLNCDEIQSLSIEISNTKSRNIMYRPPNGNMKQYQAHFISIFSKTGKNLKNMVLEVLT